MFALSLRRRSILLRAAPAEATDAAKGCADAAFETARGEGQGTLLRAQAAGKATEIQAAADATAIRAHVEAAGGVDGYGKVMAADTMRRWNGQPPQTVLGGGASPIPFLQLH